MEGGLSRAGMDVRDWRPALPSPSTADTARWGGQAKATAGGGRTGSDSSTRGTVTRGGRGLMTWVAVGPIRRVLRGRVRCGATRRDTAPSTRLRRSAGPARSRLRPGPFAAACRWRGWRRQAPRPLTEAGVGVGVGGRGSAGSPWKAWRVIGPSGGCWPRGRTGHLRQRRSRHPPRNYLAGRPPKLLRHDESEHGPTTHFTPRHLLRRRLLGRPPPPSLDTRRRTEAY